MRENDAIDLIYGAVTDPRRWSEILTGVSDYLGAIGGLVAHSAVKGQSFLICGRLSDELTDLYLKHYVWNSWSNAMKNVPFERAVATSSLVEDRVLRKTGHYADILAPQGIVDSLSTSHASMAVGGGAGGFGFMFSENASNKTAQNLGKLQRLTPHLGRALDASLQLGRYVQGQSQMEKALELMPSAAFLLNSEGRVLFANNQAEALLRSSDGLIYGDENMALSAALPEERFALAQALNEAASVADGHAALREPLRITRPSGKPPLIVMPIPLPPAEFNLWELLDYARLLVIVIDPVAQRLAQTAMVQTAFGLTAAEARVAVLIGAGFSGPQAAQTLGLSITTVKTHLAHCFEKIGINSQSALVKLFAALPIDPSSIG